MRFFLFHTWEGILLVIIGTAYIPRPKVLRIPIAYQLVIRAGVIFSSMLFMLFLLFDLFVFLGFWWCEHLPAIQNHIFLLVLSKGSVNIIV